MSIKNFILQRSDHILPIVVLFLLGIILFWPTFSLALYGDEWQMLWFGKAVNLQKYQITSEDIWGAYWNEMAVFTWIFDSLGNNGSYYYFFSYICRFLAAAFFYWFLYSQFYSKKIAFLGSVFFMVSPIGIEATDWVRNFDSYLGIIFLLIGLQIILNFKGTTSILSLMLVFLTGSLINPLRVHGVFLTYEVMLLVQLFGALGKKEMPFVKILLTSAIVLGALFFLLIKLNVFGGLSGNGLIGEAFNFSQSFRSLTVSIGNILIPNFRLSEFPFRSIIFLLMSGVVSLSFLVNGNKLAGRFLGIFLLVVAGELNYKYFYLADSLYLAAIIALFFLAIVGYWLVINIFNRTYKQTYLLTLVLCLLSAFMIYPVLRQSGFAANFDHRYLIYSALATPLLLVIFLANSFAKYKILKNIGITLTCLIIIFNGIITYRYISIASMSHPQSTCQNLRQQVFEQIRMVDFTKQKFFWFKTTRPEDDAEVYNCLTFGFMFMTGLQFQIWDQKLLPVAVYETKEGINSMLTDGKTTAKYTGQIKRVSSDDLLVFEIRDDKVVYQKNNF